MLYTTITLPLMFDIKNCDTKRHLVYTSKCCTWFIFLFLLRIGLLINEHLVRFPDKPFKPFAKAKRVVCYAIIPIASSL